MATAVQGDFNAQIQAKRAAEVAKSGQPFIIEEHWTQCLDRTRKPTYHVYLADGSGLTAPTKRGNIVGVCFASHAKALEAAQKAVGE